MTQVFHDASRDAGYCSKCQKGYAVGPHVCPAEQPPSKELSTEQLAEIGRLSIAKHIADLHAQDHHERAANEGWDNDPTGSSHLRDSSRAAYAAHNEWVMKMSEFGLLKEFENE